MSDFFCTQALNVGHLEPFLESFAAVTLCAMKTCSQKQQQLIVACFFSP